MEREFEVTGINPVLVRGEYREPGETFLAIPEEVVFYLHTCAVSTVTNDPIVASDPDLVAKVMAEARKRRRGIDSAPIVVPPTRRG